MPTENVIEKNIYISLNYLIFEFLKTYLKQMDLQQLFLFIY